MKPDLPVPPGLSSVTFRLGEDEFLLLEFPLPAFHIPDGLTASEAAVTGLLLLGGSVTEIALARKTSINTVRNQIRSVHAKLGVSNVGELARLCSPREDETAGVGAGDRGP